MPARTRCLQQSAGRGSADVGGRERVRADGVRDRASTRRRARFHAGSRARDDFAPQLAGRRPRSCGAVCADLLPGHRWRRAIRLHHELRFRGRLARRQQLGPRRRPPVPDAVVTGAVGYDLVPVYDTIWKQSQGGRNETYGESHDYGTLTISVAAGSAAQTIKAKVGRIGSAFRGLAGAANKARPPWGRFDRSERDRPLGEWFFDPANVLLRRLRDVRRWSTAYIHEPMLGIVRGKPPGS